MAIAGNIAVIGAGNMGAALVRGVVAQGLVPASNVRVIDRQPELAEALQRDLGVTSCSTPNDVLRDAAIILLCVKPQSMAQTLAELAPHVAPDTVVISVAAGISLDTLQAALPQAAIVRAMPNTPALIGRGASAFAVAPHTPDHARTAARAILGAVGLALEVDEAHMDAVTALSGSGPAYVFRMLEAMIAGGLAAGLVPETARALALQTLVGAAHLAAESDTDPAELRRRVTSPGGTTEAALRVLETGHFGDLVTSAIVAARDRGRELGARKPA
jgi:pyrroline-5-carboxylate reductase